MSEIVGIRFGDSGKTYCFEAEGIEVKMGDRVVVESDIGISIGKVYRTRCEPRSPEKELKPVLRKVTEADVQQEEENEGVKKEALDYCKERIKARGLPMKLLINEVTLDRKRFIFYFVAESRVDFRELVKDLASKFRARIELRQIGVRDAARLTGGYGVCGKEFCCKTFLKSFSPISIKMAKQQELVLNTCKLSGSCGRLMCCLSYEYLTEEEFKKVRQQEAEEARKAAEEKAAREAREAEEAEKERKAAEEAERQARLSREKAGDKPPAAPGNRGRRRRSRRKGAARAAAAGQPAERPSPPPEAARPKDKAEPDKQAKPKKRRRRRSGNRKKTE